MKIKKYSKGFTLVELLVVIAIIGILAAVVLVSLASQRNKAQESSALQSVKSGIGFAMDCVLRNAAVPVPAWGGVICTGQTAPVWPPKPSGSTCVLNGTGYTVNAAYGGTAVISGCGTGNTITCSFTDGSCK